MSSTWYALGAADDSFLASARFGYVNSVDLPISADETWAGLTCDDTLASWSRLVTALQWTSPRPFGVGTTRLVTLLGAIKVQERYYRWENGSRKTFAGVQASVPWPARVG